GTGQVREEILLRGPTGQRFEGLAAHEPIRAPRDERDHLVPGLDEQPRQLTRLVGGDPTGDSEEHLGHEHILPTEVKPGHRAFVLMNVLGNVLASPRRRKRLAILTTFVVVPVPLVFLAAHYTTSGSPGNANGPYVSDSFYREPKHVPFTAEKRRAVSAVLAEFIDAAVSQPGPGGRLG